MPTDRLHIKQVFPAWPAKDGVKRWDVITRERIGTAPDDHQIVTAVSFHEGDKGQLFAAACVAAEKTGLPLLVQWRDTRWGREITNVELASDSQVA